MIQPSGASSRSQNGHVNGSTAPQFQRRSGKQVLSIEDLLQKEQAAKEASSKPTFLSKEARKQQALQARLKQVDDERKAAEAKIAKAALNAPAPSTSNDSSRSQAQQQRTNDSYDQSRSNGSYDRRADNPRFDRGRPAHPTSSTSRRYELDSRNTSALDYGEQPTNGHSSAMVSLKRPASPTPLDEKPLNELDAPSELIGRDLKHVPVVDELAIKTRYLGANNDKKRKIRKMSDKKFVFDWDKEDDTGLSTEVDPLYRSHVEGRAGQQPGAIYGRGRLAGFDPSVTSAPSTAYTRTNDLEDEPLAGPRAMGKAVGTTTRSGALDDRHWSEKPLSEMRERDWRIFREDFSIAARGGSIPHPLRSWKESAIPLQILETIDEIGYKEPSAIQRQAIPIGLQNRDLIGIAETGSGKTAAFLIPMLDYIGRLPPLTDHNKHLGPYALVLAPTRELAQQIEAEAVKFCRPLGYRCASIVGGKSVEEQQQTLDNGVEIVIATPGRLKDCIERHVFVLEQCTYVIMDEADRMVALGFEDVVNMILDVLPVSNLKPDSEEAEDPKKMLGVVIGEGGQRQFYRQTIMFSATMPPAVERLARKYMRRPATVTIGVAGQAVDTVEQRVEFVSGDERKRQRLVEILNSEQFAPPIIVFVNQKRSADQLAKEISRARWRTTTLHSDKNQQQREEALNSLRTGDADVLVATDLAGRGIDVPDVSLVVNFNMANSIEAYVHRIGRTGRAGKQGVAITFLTNDDAEVMYDLKQELVKSPISKCPPELMKHEFAQQRITREMRKRQLEEQG